MLTKRKNVKYNLENLINYSIEKNFKLLKDYDENKINIETIIEGTCATEGCENNFSKNYKRLITISGPYCKFCQNGRVVFDNNALNLFVKKNNIILLNDYTNIQVNRDTKIEGKCILDDCINTFNKNFRYLIEEGGPYCDDCVLVNWKIKTEKTNLENFGVKYYTMTEEGKNKVKESISNKYNVNGIINIPGVKEKIKNTVKNKYGVEFISQNNEIKKKIKQTNLLKYAVENPMQNPEIAEKMIKSSYLIKDYILPSGKILKCQGHEKFGLDKLINEFKIQENDVITSRIEVPEIWYIKEKNLESAKKSRHYVDIFIPSKNLCVEVKSTWTFLQHRNDVLAKQQAGKDLGYIYEIWIFDKNGKLLEKIL